MQKEGMLAETVRLFGAISRKITGKGKIGKADAAVLKVAMMVAALDGDVSAEELAAFERLARQCRGYSAEQAAALFDEGLRLAGYLTLQAKRLSEKRLVDLFVAEAEKAMPGGFILTDDSAVRQAFVMWTAMALSDGDYSPVERKAINAYRKHLDAIVESVNDYNESRRCGYSPAFARAFVIDGQDFRFKSAATDAFLGKAEALLVRVGEGDEAAAGELKNLIVEG